MVQSSNNTARASRILITFAVITILLMAGILCIFQRVVYLSENIRNSGTTGYDYWEKKSSLQDRKTFEKYNQMEEKSYSHKLKKIGIEKKYRLNWELLYTIDLIARCKSPVTQDSFDALKPIFTYKQSVITTEKIVRKKVKEAGRKGEQPEIKKDITEEKVFLPVIIDTYYKKIIYEYETKTLITNEEAGDSINTVIIKQEQLKKESSVELENVSTRLLPYLNSIGIEGKNDVTLLLTLVRRQVKEPNEGLEYVSRYLKLKQESVDEKPGK